MLIDRLLKIALLGSEWVLYLLVVLSVVSIATMAERVVFFWRRSDNLTALRKKLVDHLDLGDVASTAALLDKSRAIEAKVAREALRWAHAGPQAMADAVDSELARIKKELENGTNLLGTLGNNAPFVGLFGTVLGVIIAFDALGEAGQNTSAMGGVMAGIAEALVATGVGLFVALPAVVAYNLIQKRIGEIETEAISLTKLIAAYARVHRVAFRAFSLNTTGAQGATEKAAAENEEAEEEDSDEEADGDASDDEAIDRKSGEEPLEEKSDGNATDDDASDDEAIDRKSGGELLEEKSGKRPAAVSVA